MRKTPRIWLIAWLSPFFLVALYFYLSRGPVPQLSGIPDIVALGLGVMIGVSAILSLDATLPRRVFLALAYAAVCSLALAVFSLVFVCYMFKDCL